MFGLSSWLTWGIALLVLFPVLIIGLGELADDIRESPTFKAYGPPIMVVRNGVLPLAFGAILLRYVAGIDGQELIVKVADTVLWIVVLNAALAFLNLMLFNNTRNSVRIPKLLLDIMRFVFVVCGAAVIISAIWGVNLGSLVTALGVGSLVIGLALQDTLGSLFSGIALVSARHFRVGDWVKFGKDEGPVLAQNWRSVTIKTRLGDALIVPNGVIARAPLTLLGNGGSVTLLAEMRFPYAYSPDLVCSVLTETAKKTDGFHLDPMPAARVTGFDEFGVKYLVVIRTLDPAKIYAVRSEFYINAWFSAQRSGLVFAAMDDNAYSKHPLELREARHGEPTLKERLLATPGFSFGHADVTRLLSRAILECYRPGQPLAETGKVSPNVHVILRGLARAVQPSPTGGETALHDFDIGQIVLTKATLRGAGMPYAIKALSDLEVVSIPVADFKAHCDANMPDAHMVEQILSAREDSALRTLTKAHPDQVVNGAGDRSQLMKDLFRS